jgi:hypothetical protein
MIIVAFTAIVASIMAAGYFLNQRINPNPIASPTQTIELIFPTQPDDDLTAPTPTQSAPSDETPTTQPTIPTQNLEPTPSLTPWPTNPPSGTVQTTPSGI